jgi:hypothetical protein
MKNLIKQKYAYYMYKQFFLIIKGIFTYLLILFILVFYYYICIHIYVYSFTNYNDQLNTLYVISFEELKSIDKNQANFWYKNILNDFFNKFTSNSKTINSKFIKVELDNTLKTLIPLEHDYSAMKKSVILNKIQSDCIKSIITECEFYKDKIYLLEIQLLNTKIAYINLVKDINDIVKEMNNSFLKS